ncbi:hypothetical protein GGX14DRAFT_652493 [Mycena pura]|uniref:Uncharacterized protein n=1 Tax=Mycena pura TaxID=153505 RepID=A0AAD6V4W6_9AGAR|nr:hypothetical protein GGX14DRAFT_652493 [Mycena pura]
MRAALTHAFFTCARPSIQAAHSAGCASGVGATQGAPGIGARDKLAEANAQLVIIGPGFVQLAVKRLVCARSMRIRDSDTTDEQDHGAVVCRDTHFHNTSALPLFHGTGGVTRRAACGHARRRRVKAEMGSLGQQDGDAPTVRPGGRYSKYASVPT